MDKSNQFWSVQIDGTFHLDLRGVMYAKPNKETVLASLYVPPGVEVKDLRKDRWITLSAMCSGYGSMENIKAWVDHYVRLPGTGRFYTLIMYRKGKEPPEAFE